MNRFDVSEIAYGAIVLLIAGAVAVAVPVGIFWAIWSIVT